MPASLPHPEEVLQAAQNAESELRALYLALDSSQRSVSTDAGDRDLLERSAAVLEIMAASACFVEAAHEEGAPPYAPLSPLAREHFRNRVRQLCGLDLDAIVPRAVSTLRWPKPTGERHPLPTLAAMLRAVRSLIEVCPIDHLEELGRCAGIEPAAHRCRVAHDALRAYAIRNDPATNVRLKLVGRTYSQGVWSAAECATVLGMTVPDALALLEAHGHQMPLELIGLDDAARDASLAAIRKDRLERGGDVVFDRRHLVRDVIASERIEGVDARTWLVDEPT